LSALCDIAEALRVENPSLLRSEGLTQAIATPLGQFHYERYCVESSYQFPKDASEGAQNFLSDPRVRSGRG